MTTREEVLRAARENRLVPASRTRTTTLPRQPWRYTLTPALAKSLVRAGEYVGELRALPISFLRRVDLEAEARRARILGRTAHEYSSVSAREVDAVLAGAVLAPRRRGIMDRIRGAAIVEDALDRYAIRDAYLTAAHARAYAEALTARFSASSRVWSAFSGRQRRHLLDLVARSAEPTPELSRVLSWVDADDLGASSAVLRSATTYWGMSLLGWYDAAEVGVHHQLRAGGYDPHGLVIGPRSAPRMLEVLDRTPETMDLADGGDFTALFERFAARYESLVHGRLLELGRVRDIEAHLPWTIVAPPDALDARLVELVERRGQVGSAEIEKALGRDAPPLRTLQRRLGKLVAGGTIGRRGSRKTALYIAAERGTTRE